MKAPWLSRSSGHQRPERQVESASDLASFFRAAAFRLRNLLRGVSEKVLSTQLRELQRDGVVNRTAALSSPPKVTYSLSRSGEALISLLEGFCDWGSKQFGIKPNLYRRRKRTHLGPVGSAMRVAEPNTRSPAARIACRNVGVEALRWGTRNGNPSEPSL